jgi:gluconate 2-dehydrogenase gamma chain
MLHRRDLLATAAWLALSSVSARARVLGGALPWIPNAGDPPDKVRPGPWHFFTNDEAKAIEALADRIIPPDAQTPGGKDAGCAVYLDRQLAGPYGHNDGHYNRPPFMPNAPKNFGSQSPNGPAAMYRKWLAALDKYCHAQYGGKAFAALGDSEKDRAISDLESGSARLDNADGRVFVDHLIKDIQEGFFADPIYGGNRDMAAWKMIGFPGARYNYLDWIDRHNERYPLPPVSMTGRAEWTRKAS